MAKVQQVGQYKFKKKPAAPSKKTSAVTLSQIKRPVCTVFDKAERFDLTPLAKKGGLTKAKKSPENMTALDRQALKEREISLQVQNAEDRAEVNHMLIDAVRAKIVLLEKIQQENDGI
jgi:hypothetical protein